MLVKTLLKHCETGFELIVIADSTTGHTMEYSNVKDAQIEAGGNKVISWETGAYIDGRVVKMVLLITI